ncbi:hypothetical protein BC628DRAFT_1337721 [Trametes gibbosa]|nr:hypothetical protein BC628DRAFT_1337721 [Trametes gibbosa]
MTYDLLVVFGANKRARAARISRDRTNGGTQALYTLNKRLRTRISTLLLNSFSIPKPEDATLVLMTEFLNKSSESNSVGSVGSPRAFTVPIVVVAEFATVKVAASFKDYLLHLEKPPARMPVNIGSSDMQVAFP